MAGKIDITTNEIEKTSEEYKRQGSIDDENFLYLANGLGESVESASTSLTEDLSDLKDVISDGDKSIKESIDNIELKCDNSDIVEEMQNESIGDKLKEINESIQNESIDINVDLTETNEKLEEIKDAIKSGGSSEVEEQIEKLNGDIIALDEKYEGESDELHDLINTINTYLNYFTDFVLRRYDAPSYDEYLSEKLTISSWDKDLNRSVRFGPVCNLRLMFTITTNSDFVPRTAYNIMAISGKMIPEHVFITAGVTSTGKPFRIYITANGRVQFGSDEESFESEEIRINITYVNYQVEKDWESEDE